MKKLLLILATMFMSTAFAEQGEVYLANSAGGWIVLTHEECSAETVKDYFPWRGYATEGNGAVHEACYEIPSIDDAPKQRGVKIIPVVNFIELEDKTIHVFQADWFTSEGGPEKI